MDTKIKEEEMLKFPQRPHQDGSGVDENPVVGTQTPGEISVQQAQFQQFDSTPANPGQRDRKLEILMGISLPISIELGRTNLEIRNILDWKRGSVIEFDKMASEPVDIVINGKKMAEGEVVVIDKHFAIRITNLVETSERLKGLAK